MIMNDNYDNYDNDEGERRWRHWWLDHSEDPRDWAWQDCAGELLDTDQPLLSLHIWMHRSGEINFEKKTWDQWSNIFHLQIFFWSARFLCLILPTVDMTITVIIIFIWKNVSIFNKYFRRPSIGMVGAAPVPSTSFKLQMSWDKVRL